ncbi:peptidylprolyl isomerase [Oricola thermophila]|uniref:Parvulin-like PPIase n=1 Tax=Oricola thermophila TaxID=2742145 RepID=A0A6N1VG47_9HYPH|nr:peptidylprolyl isomerase [Oricola thermophila]QKV18119.1 peptidyl-prolyl cis-trans isomerase [Oricola thermophila]
MLDGLRNASKSWVAKALLLLLLVSFGVWGVSGQIFTGVAGDAVVTAGQTKVSALDYRLAYDRQLAAYSRQLGERLTAEQARLFGVDRAVLGQMVAGAVLDEQSRVMQLGLSKDRLAILIAEDPAFQGADGRFSRDNFRIALRNIGMTEEEYIRSRENVAIRQQIVEAVSDGIQVPGTMLEAFAQHSGEKRDVQYITIGDSVIEPVEAPGEDELRAYFEAHKADYRAPEYRKIDFVRLTPEAIVDEAAISEEAVRADYEARKDRYTAPETRTIEQLVFADDAAAAAAHERILAGQSFEDAVADAGRTMDDVRIGTFAKADLPDPAVAEAAFSLGSPGEVSNLIEGAFGKVIVRVTAINPARVQPFEEVSEDIRRELALVEANDVLLDIHDAYEDARAGGATMQEAAEGQKLQMQTIEAVDEQGMSPSGEPVSSIPEQDALIAAAFETDIGIENPPLDAADSGFLWYEVREVTPARDREFEEVRDRVTEDWMAEETESRIAAKAQSLAERLAAGESLEELAESEGVQIETKYGLQRGATDADFGGTGVSEIFDGGPDHSGTFPAPAGNTYKIFRVTSVSQAVGGAENLGPGVREGVRTSMADDLLDQMVAKLQTIYPVEINQNAIQRALSIQ